MMAIPILPCPGCSATPWSRAPAGSHHATQFWVLINLELWRLVFFFFLGVWDCRRAAAALGVPLQQPQQLSCNSGSAQNKTGWMVPTWWCLGCP